MEQQLVENLQQWFEAGTRTITIPSGLVCKVKLATTANLMANGQLPIPIALNWDDEIDKIRDRLAEGKKPSIEESTSSLQARSAMYNAVCKAVLIWPKIGDITILSGGIISIDDLSLEDKEAIFNEATRGVRLLDKFPAKSAEPTDSTQLSLDLSQ